MKLGEDQNGEIVAIKVTRESLDDKYFRREIDAYRSLNDTGD